MATKADLGQARIARRRTSAPVRQRGDRGILGTLAVAAWGSYASLGGQPLFGEPRSEAI